MRERVTDLIPPGEAHVVDAILAWLAGEGPGDAADAVRRFQQLSAPIAAKSVEDTAFYRSARLLSRNDVGFDATILGIGVDAFHDLMAARAHDVPHAMLTTATHDHKRGEDLRARLAALSVMPDAWRSRVEAWDQLSWAWDHDVSGADRYMLLQTIVGAWPDEGATPDFADRIKAWQQKALREARLRSSWEAPDEAYEAAAAALTDAFLADPRFVAEVTAFVATLRRLQTPIRSSRRCSATPCRACPTYTRAPNSPTSASSIPTTAAPSIMRSVRRCSTHRTRRPSSA